ncbi:MAG: DUF2321 domain-containing protein [Terriglobia bacterium]
MMDNKSPKVLITQKVLRGSGCDEVLQRIATVYDGNQEYRVLAPAQARGPVLEWMEHLSVHKPAGVNSEEVVQNADRTFVLKAFERELKRQARDTNRAQGLNPDSEHCDAQICLNGHVLHCDGMPFSSACFCPKCGARCIDECSACEEPIRGKHIYQVGPYSLPQFCHNCGHAYPWMEERLRTVRELLSNERKLSVDDLKSLLEDLQYVMSDPKAELVPAKRRLIEFKLENVSKTVREFVLDLAAKVIVESAKP